MSGRPISFWDDSERVDMLQRLFGQGIIIAEIARLMGHTKNAISGRLDRMGMKRREVPPTTTTLERLAALLSVFPPHRRCLWPYGDPGAPGFAFCGAPSMVDNSYCAMHAAQSYDRKGRPAE
jgi:hypothetical protein